MAEPLSGLRAVELQGRVLLEPGFSRAEVGALLDADAVRQAQPG